MSDSLSITTDAGCNRKRRRKSQELAIWQLPCKCRWEIKKKIDFNILAIFQTRKRVLLFVIFGERVFQQTIGIPMCTNCAPILADSFLYTYDADFIQGPLKKNEKKLARSFNFTFRYIDDVLSLNNSRFGDFFDRIYPIELEIKDTIDTATSAPYLDLRLEIDSEDRLRTKFYDKGDVFNFPIVKFPFICSNIPAVPAYGVYISQLIRYSRACGSYQDFLDRGLLLTKKLLNQGFLLVKFKSSLRKLYERHHDLVNRYVSQTTTDVLHLL